jgi:hypothetical protein
MKKLLVFEIKHNLHRAARVYVKSPDLKVIYGSFSTDNTSIFDNWDKLTIEQTIELKQFIQNLNAITDHLKPIANNALTDFRFRLPVNVINTLNALSVICYQEKIELNVYDSMILNIIQQMKVATTKLSNGAKAEALHLLEKAGIAEYKKQDYHSQIQAIFTELLNIHNKSEKLHEKAKLLFDKDKSYSPKAIESMATGESNPSKWLVACAIDVLIDEQINLSETISPDDLFMLWAKQLLDNDTQTSILVDRAILSGNKRMVGKINDYHPS